MIPETSESSNLFNQYLETFKVKTAALKWALSTFSDLSQEEKEAKMSELINKTMSYSRRLLSIPDPADRARAVHEMIDRLNDDVGGAKVECNKGCSHCCHWKVDATIEEAELIADFVKENNIEIDQNHLDSIASRSKDESFWLEGTYEERACVFLSNEGKCQVYPVRPSSCRKVLVTNKNRYCKDPRNKKIEPLISIEAEVLTSIDWSSSRESTDVLEKKFKKVTSK